MDHVRCIVVAILICLGSAQTTLTFVRLVNGRTDTPVALQLKALGVPFVLSSAADRAVLAQNSALAEARNLGKPTDMRQLVAAVAAVMDAAA